MVKNFELDSFAPQILQNNVPFWKSPQTFDTFESPNNDLSIFGMPSVKENKISTDGSKFSTENSDLSNFKLSDTHSSAPRPSFLVTLVPIEHLAPSVSKYT